MKNEQIFIIVCTLKGINYIVFYKKKEKKTIEGVKYTLRNKF